MGRKRVAVFQVIESFDFSNFSKTQRANIAQFVKWSTFFKATPLQFLLVCEIVAELLASVRRSLSVAR